MDSTDDLNTMLIRNLQRGCSGRDCMVIGSTTTYVISAHHHERWAFESRSCRGELDATLCDKLCR